MPQRQATKYQLELLGEHETARWDELIAPYENRQLFHRKVWLDYLAASHKIELRLWAIRHRNSLVGYFCGGVIRKGPFRILGSPLKGWGTNFLGPVVNRDFDQRAFLGALDELAHLERFAMIETETPLLSDSCLEEAHYEPVTQWTYLVDLPPGGPHAMGPLIHQKARKAVRLAQQYGLVVEDTDDPSIADELYDQYTEILARKGLFPTFPRTCPRRLFEALKPRDLLFALRVRAPNGDVVATGLFPHDERTLYFSFTGSRISAWKLFPNDLLQWTAMDMAAARGLRAYNMCGYGQFKSKFGGTLHEFKRWHKFYSPAARWARDAYQVYSDKRIKLRGWWEKVSRDRRQIEAVTDFNVAKTSHTEALSPEKASRCDAPR